MENCKLPKEVLIEILARLPVMSLIRFKSVCKFMYCLIKSDYHFQHKHYEISGARSDYVIFEREIGVWPWPSRFERAFGLLYKESDSDEIGCIDLVMPSSEIRNVKCIDGIFCVIAYGKDGYNFRDILIWNPFTREIKALPPISIPENFDSNQLYEMIGCGFCNNMTGKVVIVWGCQGQYKVMVCSQVGNLWGWRQINPYPHFDDLWLMPRYDIYLKGKYYWYLYTYQDEDLKHDLLWFDMSDESFGTISLPSNPNGGKGFRWAVVSELNDRIALIGYREDRWEVWLMNENNCDVNWHKYTSFDCTGSWQPIRIWNQGRHLLICQGTVEEDELVSIDLVNGEKKIFGNIRCYIPNDCFLVYHESLKLF